MTKGNNAACDCSGDVFGLPATALQRMQDTVGEPMFIHSIYSDKVRLTISLQLLRSQLQTMREAMPVEQPRRDFHSILVEALRETLLQHSR